MGEGERERERRFGQGWRSSRTFMMLFLPVSLSLPLSLNASPPRCISQKIGREDRRKTNCVYDGSVARQKKLTNSFHPIKCITFKCTCLSLSRSLSLNYKPQKQGDSGGPLMLNQFGVWYLVGIVSAGYSCAKQYQPGIYHRVSIVVELLLFLASLVQRGLPRWRDRSGDGELT